MKEEIWIDTEISNIIPIPVLELIKPFNFKSMYELGNKKTDGIPYREFYENKNIEYDCIDLNGLDGALQLDLQLQLDLPSRKMVTNIGTSEHIKNQKQVFKNIHNLSNYRIVHWVPFYDKRPRHGYYGYTREFFIRLALLNNYQIKKLYFYKPRNILCCSYVKKSKDEFQWDYRLSKLLHRKKQGRGGVIYK